MAWTHAYMNFSGRGYPGLGLGIKL